MNHKHESQQGGMLSHDGVTRIKTAPDHDTADRGG